MNLYQSDALLDVANDVFFDGGEASKAIFNLDGRQYRMLSVDGVPQWGLPFFDYHEPIADADADTFADDERIDAEFIGNACWGRVPIENWATEFVEGTGEGASFPPRLHPSGECFRGAPVVDFRKFGDDHDAYLAFLRSKSSLIKSDQRMQRRLSEIPGGFDFHPNDPGEDVLPWCFAVKSEQTLATLGVDLFGHPENKAFFLELQRRNMLMASTLRNGDELLSAWLGVIHDGSWNGWIYVYNHSEKFRKLSVGRQLMYFVLKECHGRGIAEFDFSIGYADYKDYFSTDVRVVGARGLPPLRDRLQKALRKNAREFAEEKVFPRAPWVKAAGQQAIERVRKRRWEKTGRL